MDAIQSLDEGAYAFFDFLAKKYPWILTLMQPAYFVSSCIGIGVLLAIIVVLFLRQGNRRAAVASALSCVSAVLLIELIRIAVPRARPQNAVLWLGDGAKVGSYPSGGVLLFMLCLILLGNAIWKHLHPGLRGTYVVVAMLLTIWVCVSQFFLGIHYVTDVIGGLAGATLISWVAASFSGNHESTIGRKHEKELDEPVNGANA